MAPARFVPLLILVGMSFCACVPKIGDDCVTDRDCSQQNDRLCDTTQPGGYCTLANCDPFSCPEKESVCVAFNSTRSSVGLCDNPSQPSPHLRSFCMATCGTSSQCRPGYACVDLSEDNPLGAEIIEEHPESTRVCLMAESIPDIDSDHPDDFCSLDAAAAGAPAR